MSSDSEVEEIKIVDVKNKLEEKQKELVALNKKRSRTNKKNTKNLLEKYKTEVFKDIDVETKTSNNLMKQKKVRNVKIFDEDENMDSLYEKDDFLLKILDDKTKFKETPKEILNFRSKHFYGGRIKRTGLNKILSIK